MNENKVREKEKRGAKEEREEESLKLTYSNEISDKMAGVRYFNLSYSQPGILID